MLSRVHRFRGELPAARTQADRAVRALADSGDLWRCGMAAHNLGAIAEYEGDALTALEHYRSAAEWMSKLGNHRQRAVILGDIGGVLTTLGRPTEVVAALEEALEVAEEFGDQHGRVALLARLGTAHLVAGNLEQAEELLDEALRLARSAGQRQMEWTVLQSMGECAAAAGARRRAGERLLEAIKINDEIDFTPGFAGCLVTLASCAVEEGQLDAAASLVAAAQALREQDGSQTDTTQAEHVIARVEAGLPARQVYDARTRGRRWSRRETLDVARATVGSWRSLGSEPRRCDADDRWGLTRREREVAEHLRARRTDQEIADTLHISVRTVTTHVSAVLRKLNVSSRRDVDGALQRLSGDGLRSRPQREIRSSSG